MLAVAYTTDSIRVSLCDKIEPSIRFRDVKIIIIIIMWFVQRTLPFPRATSSLLILCSMIGSCQTNVEWSDIRFIRH